MNFGLYLEFILWSWFSSLGKDSCSGDSGGPMIAREDPRQTMYLAGVVSTGPITCGSGYPGIYTSVDHFLDWIKDKLKP